jgi:hypothetical protein
MTGFEVVGWITLVFDKYAIATYDAERPLAEQYAAAMSRRLAGLRGTSAPLLPSGHPDGDAT